MDLLHSSGNLKNLIHRGEKNHLFGNTRQASRLMLLPVSFTFSLFAFETPQQFVGNFHSNLVDENLNKSPAVLTESRYSLSSELQQ